MSDEKNRPPEEDLSKGPTPEIRREDDEPEREHGTSEGPTPEAREAERRS